MTKKRKKSPDVTHSVEGSNREFMDPSYLFNSVTWGHTRQWQHDLTLFPVNPKENHKLLSQHSRQPTQTGFKVQKWKTSERHKKGKLRVKLFVHFPPRQRPFPGPFLMANLGPVRQLVTILYDLCFNPIWRSSSSPPNVPI